MQIKKITEKDFNKNGSLVYINNNNKPGMLLIWAKWCGHCHRFLPTFNDINDSIGKDYNMTAIEYDDLNKSNWLSDSLGVNGFPTIKFFDQSGKIIDTYEGSRNKLDLLEHICNVYHKCIRK